MFVAFVGEKIWSLNLKDSRELIAHKPFRTSPFIRWIRWNIYWLDCSRSTSFSRSGKVQMWKLLVEWTLCSILSLFSWATAKAECDLSSLSCVFLCVEWGHSLWDRNDTPLGHNWLSQSECRIPVTWQQK